VYKEGEREREVRERGEKGLGVCVWGGGEDRQRERSLLTINKCLKFGKRNDLSGTVIPPVGTRGPGCDSEHYTPTLCLALWNALADTGGRRHPLAVRPNHLAGP
jgi:hypothetical protein